MRRTIGRVLAFVAMVAWVCPARADGLPRTVAAAIAMERADALPLTAFYATPENLASTRPGDLLRSEPFSGYSLPTGARAVRILYHSLDGTGVDVATSGVVLIPAGAPPAGGWPIIAWAHGTSGVARRCAPSLMKDVYYGGEGLMPMVAAGYAVVATDYHGLGTAGPHQLIDKLAQARDVVYSIPAARAAVAALGARWVVDGHSEGGLAAWGVAELEQQLKDPNYLGAVSVAGVMERRDMSLFAQTNDTAGEGFYLPFDAYGIKALYPEFKPAAFLSAAALEHYREVTTEGCWYYGYATYRKTPPGTFLRPQWRRNPWVRRFLDGDALGRVPIDGPILVLAGGADRSIPIIGVRATVRRACRIGQQVWYRGYPGLDHGPLMAKSTPYQLAWIKARFEGQPAASNCPAARPGR